jgi:hypothetical protein
MAAGMGESSAPWPVPPRHSAGDTTGAGDRAAGDFDFARPFEIDLGRAAVIAEVLRECGYASCTADTVIAELAMPGDQRSVIGQFAASALARAGWRP